MAAPFVVRTDNKRCGFLSFLEAVPVAAIEELLSTSQTAKALDVCEARVRQMIARQELPAHKSVLGALLDPQVVAELAAQRAEAKAAAAADA